MIPPVGRLNPKASNTPLSPPATAMPTPSPAALASTPITNASINVLDIT